jgi:hypothetical protein
MNKKTVIIILIALAVIGGAAYNVMNPTEYKHPMQR